MERKDGKMTIALGLHSYEDLEKHIHERISDFIGSGAVDNINFANGALAVDAVISIIVNNHKVYFKKKLLHPLLVLLGRHKDFNVCIPDMMQKSFNKDEAEEILSTIWVMLFRKVLVENYVEFRDKWYSRRVEYGESGKI